MTDSVRFIQGLHRAVGNRAVQRLLATGPAVVQREDAARHGPSDDEVRAAAAEGVRTPGGPMPFLGRIQGSFGRHAVGHVTAHAGEKAAQAAGAMDALAFASGSHVVFGAEPDLHTAAHEAAHVVQQQAGVQLAGGIGREGDAYERNADAVADAVVAGRSAEALLDPFATAGDRWTSAQGDDPRVQRVVYIGGQKLSRTGRDSRRLWEALRDAMVRSRPALSPHGSHGLFNYMLKESQAFDYATEAEFIHRFVVVAAKEARHGATWTRLLKLRRPAWPETYKAWVRSGEDIRHIVRSAALKRAIEGERDYQLRYGDDDHARAVMQSIAAAMGIGGTFRTSYDAMREIFERAYLNPANLFFEPGAINRVIGLAADPIAAIGARWAASPMPPSPEEAWYTLNEVRLIIGNFAEQNENLARRMDREAADVYLHGFEEFQADVDDYLLDLMDAWREDEGTQQELAAELQDIGANFGFDLPNEPLPRVNAETLVATERFLGSYRPGSDPHALGQALARFVELQGRFS